MSGGSAGEQKYKLQKDYGVSIMEMKLLTSNE